MKKVFTTGFMLIPGIAKAATKLELSLWENLFDASIPVILLFCVLWFFTRKNKVSNEKLLESNLEVARQVQRIADHLEKQSK